VVLNSVQINRFKERYNLVVVLGPTASGKTRLAVGLARRLNGEIISVDSRQVYRGLDLGTGKDISEYSGDWGSIPVHLIDIIDPAEEFNLFSFQKHFFSVMADISRRGKFPVVAGGTGLYLDSILRGYRLAEVPQDKALRTQLESENTESLRKILLHLNPALHNKTDLVDRNRMIRAIEIARFQNTDAGKDMGFCSLLPFVIGIRCNREELRRRITLRLHDRIERGLIDEVRRLHEQGLSWERLDSLGLEYRYVGLYLRGQLSFNDMVQILNTRIHQFAKRQETWFRKIEKSGIIIHWIENPDPQEVYSLMINADDELRPK